MKSKLVVFALVVFSVISGFAQVEDNYPKRSMMSINATGFFSNYVNLGTTTSNTPYLIDYRYAINKKLQIRSGLNFSSSSMNNDMGNGRRDKSNSQNIDFRLGILSNNEISKKWSWYYGLDLIFSEFMTTSINQTAIFASGKQGTAVVENLFYNQQFGGGPIFGLKWDVSSRISIWTESRLYYTYTESINTTTWSDFSIDIPENDRRFDERKTDNYLSSTRFFLPLDVFVGIKF
jgi:hypothetical protein